MNQEESTFLHPTRALQGWYVAARSKAVKTGEVKTVEILHRRIVLFRGEDGQIRIVDGVCPHMGANLGHGSVVGNELRCAFHGWQFSGNPCSEGPEVGEKRLRVYPSMERWGLIWFFNGPKPLWQLPEPEPKLFPLVMPSATLSCHPHLMIANGLDEAHMEALHDVSLLEPAKLEVNPPYEVALTMHGRSSHGFLGWLSGGDIRSTFKTIGGNMAWVDVWSPFRCHFLFTGVVTEEGCRSQVVLFLPRSVRAAQAIVMLYLLLHDDSKILNDIDFSPNFTEADRGLAAFVNVVNQIPTG